MWRIFHLCVMAVELRYAVINLNLSHKRCLNMETKLSVCFMCHNLMQTRPFKEAVQLVSTWCIFCACETNYMEMNPNCNLFSESKKNISFISDKMGIKTTVQAIVAAKQNITLPNPETRTDFLKCKCFLICLNNIELSNMADIWIWAFRLEYCNDGDSQDVALSLSPPNPHHKICEMWKPFWEQ